jgi:hypothetical protein
MSYWDNLPPTEKQVIAIKSYNSAYGVKIDADTEQKAHDVISKFCPVQKLEFTVEGFVKGTNIPYKIINLKLFNENPYNKWLRDEVKNIRVENGMAYFTVVKKDSRKGLNNLLSALQKNMDERLEYPSFDEISDDLGFLSLQEQEEEMDMYGSNPMWWK